MEIIDVVNEKNELIGKIETRQIVHQNNLWHRHISCWIINEKGEILFQKRSLNKKNNPDMWSKLGGHILSGEKPKEALKREIREELGVDIYDKNITLVGIYKSGNEINKYFSYEYIVNVEYDIKDYEIQFDELSEVRYITINEMLDLRKIGDKNYTFNKWNDNDFYNQIEVIKKYSGKV